VPPLTFLPAPRVLLAATVGALGLADLTLGVVLRAAPIIFWPLTSLRGTLAALPAAIVELGARDVTLRMADRARWWAGAAARVADHLVAALAAIGRRSQ